MAAEAPQSGLARATTPERPEIGPRCRASGPDGPARESFRGREALKTFHWKVFTPGLAPGSGLTPLDNSGSHG